jgi:hypothetical protein
MPISIHRISKDSWDSARPIQYAILDEKEAGLQQTRYNNGLCRNGISDPLYTFEESDSVRPNVYLHKSEMIDTLSRMKNHSDEKQQADIDKAIEVLRNDTGAT